MITARLHALAGVSVNVIAEDAVPGNFAPVADGKLHTLDVRVKTPGVTVRARKAYSAR